MTTDAPSKSPYVLSGLIGRGDIAPGGSPVAGDTTGTRGVGDKACDVCVGTRAARVRLALLPEFALEVDVEIVLAGGVVRVVDVGVKGVPSDEKSDCFDRFLVRDDERCRWC